MADSNWLKSGMGDSAPATSLPASTPDISSAPAAPAVAPLVASKPPLTSGTQQQASGSDMGAGGTQAGAPEPQPVGSPVSPTFPTPPIMPTPQAMPTAPTMQPGPAANPAPGLPQPTAFQPIHRPAPPPAAPAPLPVAQPNFLDQAITSVGQFGRGVGGGAVDVASQGRSLVDMLRGKVQRNANADWQNQYESKISEPDKQSFGYNAGKFVGATGTYAAGAVGVAGAATAAGVSAPAAGALGLGAMALEGAGGGAAQSAQDQYRTGKRINHGDVAVGAAQGAVLGAAGGAAGLAAKKYIIGPALKKFLESKNAVSKQADVWIKKLIKQVVTMLDADEQQQVTKAVKALGPQPPHTPLAAKQRDLMQKAAKPKVRMTVEHARKYNEPTPEPQAPSTAKPAAAPKPKEEWVRVGDMEYNLDAAAPEIQAAYRAAKEIYQRRKGNVGMTGNSQDQGKHLKGLGMRFSAQKRELFEKGTIPKELQGQGTPAAKTDASGPWRKPLQSLGYDAINDAMPVEKILAQIPKELHQPVKDALTRVGQAKALVAHLTNQVEAYAENALNHARTPKQFGDIKSTTTTRLKSGKQRELDKEYSRLHQEQAHERNGLQSTLEGLTSLEEQAAGDARAVFTDQINKIGRRLQEFGQPRDLLHVPETKHMHSIANRHDLPTPLEPLAKGFDDAYKQFEKADTLLKAAETVFERVKREAQPAFEKVEQAMGMHEPIQHSVSHPKFPGEIMGSTGLRFDPSTSRLIGKYSRQYNQIKAALEAMEGNIVVETVHRAARQLNMPPGLAEKLLKDEGLNHPMGKTLLMAAALGVQSLNMPAEASDLANKSPQERASFFNTAGTLGVGAVVTALVLKRNFGTRGAMHVLGSSQWMHRALFGIGDDMAKQSDAILGKFHPAESLSYAMKDWRGKLMQAVTLKDDAELLFQIQDGRVSQAELAAMKAAGGGLTPEGEKYLADLHQLDRSVKTFAHGYLQEWNKHLETLAPGDRDKLRDITAGVNYAAGIFGAGGGSSLDAAASKVMAGASKYFFMKSPKLALGMVLHDLPAVGGLKVGPGAMYDAMRLFAGDHVVRGLVQRLHLGGARSDAIREAIPKSGPILIEQVQAQVSLLGSLYRQYQTRMPELQMHGVKDARDFIVKSLSGQLPQDVQDTTYQIGALDVAEMTGADPTGFGRHISQLGSGAYSSLMKYTGAPMREARLLKNNVAESITLIRQGELGAGLQRLSWLGNAMGIKAQVGGGKALVPAGVGAVLLSTPWTAEATAKFMTSLNNISLVQNTVGDMSNTVNYDPVLAPMMGMQAPGMESAFDAAKNIFTASGDIAAIGEVLTQEGQAVDSAMAGHVDKSFGALQQGAGELLTGSKRDKVINKGQKALKNLIGDLGIAFPTIAGVPTRMIGQAISVGPDIANRETTAAVRSPAPVGDAMPLESTAVMEYSTRPMDYTVYRDAIMRIMGFRPKAELNYELARQARKATGGTAGTEALENAAGIAK